MSSKNNSIKAREVLTLNEDAEASTSREEEQVEEAAANIVHEAAIANQHYHEEAAGGEAMNHIWFLLSDYIRPQDVPLFASICEFASQVVSTPAFWLRLYKRHYRSAPNLPECLEAAQHYMYLLSENKVNAGATVQGELDTLIKRKCIDWWQEYKDNKWINFFKLKQVEQEKNRNIPQPGISFYEDACCKVLKVTSRTFNYIPPGEVRDKSLYSTKLSMVDSQQECRLHLIFVSDCNLDVPRGTYHFHLQQNESSKCANFDSVNRPMTIYTAETTAGNIKMKQTLETTEASTL